MAEWLCGFRFKFTGIEKDDAVKIASFYQILWIA